MPVGYTPVYRILRGGVDITDNFEDRTTFIKVELGTTNAGNDTVEIIVDDRDWKIASPQVGDYIEVHMGYLEVDLTRMGKFEVDDVTYFGPPKQIRIHGNAAGTGGALKSPEVKDWSESTLKEILDWIAQKGSATAAIHPEIGKIKIPFKNSVTSPMNLLTELSRQYNFVAKWSENQLIIVPRDQGELVDGITHAPIFVLRPEHFQAWSVKHTNRTNYGKVQAAYRDPIDGIRKWVDAKRPTGGNEEGAANDDNYQIGRIFPTKEAAEAAAQAYMAVMRRQEGQGSFKLAKGDPWIKDQQRILVIGMRDGVNGSYIVDRVAHTFTKAKGLETEILTEQEGAGVSFEDMYAADKSNFLIPEPGEIIGKKLNPHGGRLAGPV